MYVAKQHSFDPLTIEEATPTTKGFNVVDKLGKVLANSEDCFLVSSKGTVQDLYGTLLFTRDIVQKHGEQTDDITMFYIYTTAEIPEHMLPLIPKES